MRSFTAILLSLSLLASTTGLSVLKHYCGGELAKTQVLAPHHHEQERQCGDNEKQTDCPHCETEKQSCHKESRDQQKGQSQDCCDNEVQQIKVEDHFVSTSLNFQVLLNSLTLRPFVTEALSHLAVNKDFNIKHYLRAKLPNAYIAPELRVSIQSFLI